jgi:hypothetical protein
MTKLQQAALDAIVRGEIHDAHVATHVQNLRIVYTTPDGVEHEIPVGNRDCVILELASRSAQPAGVYEMHEK